MKTNRELRAAARSQLQGGWLAAVGMLLVYGIIIGASTMVVIGPLVLGGPLLFGLYLSFIGWVLLCCLSFGIGFLWLYPYINLSVANFYEDLKQNQQVSVSGPA